MRRNLYCIALSSAALAFAAPASAATYVFAGVLGPEVAGATGTGLIKLTFDTAAGTLGIQANWSGLTGTTTVAHIHCCVDLPGTVGVAVTPGTLPGFPTGVSGGAYSTVLDLTQTATYTGGFLAFGGGTAAGAQAALLTGLQSQRAYFNIHSTRFPGGEIRVFPAAVPEPESWALLIVAFGLMGGAMRAAHRRAGDRRFDWQGERPGASA